MLQTIGMFRLERLLLSSGKFESRAFNIYGFS